MTSTLIQTLDEYIHYEEQLKRLRIQGGEEYYPNKFAIQLAVYFRLTEYDDCIGMPWAEMPDTAGDS